MKLSSPLCFLLFTSCNMFCAPYLFCWCRSHGVTCFSPPLICFVIFSMICFFCVSTCSPFLFFCCNILILLVWLGILSTLLLTFYLLCYLFLLTLLVSCSLQTCCKKQVMWEQKTKNRCKQKEREGGGCESAPVPVHLVMWAYCVAKCRAFLRIPDIGAIIYSDEAQHSLWASVMHSRPLGQIRMHAWWQMATSAPAATRTHPADANYGPMGQSRWHPPYGARNSEVAVHDLHAPTSPSAKLSTQTRTPLPLLLFACTCFLFFALTLLVSCSMFASCKKQVTSARTSNKEGKK